MRLTLRTLLAYLDDMLTPVEAEQLKQRLNESEFASGLVQRIRHAVQRVRLNAPKVNGRGLGSDANSVAEYFDSTMPPDRVVDFEKVCLESDVHLAEVAACHEILAKLFDEHPQVSDPFRQRIYQLKDRLAAVPSGADSVGSNGESVEAPPAAALPPDSAEPPANAPPANEPPVAEAKVERPKPVVPDYLRPDPVPRRGSGWMLIPLALLVLVAGAFFVPPLNQYNPLTNTPQISEVPEDPGPIALPEETEEGKGGKGKGDEDQGKSDLEKGKTPAIVEPMPVKPAVDPELENPGEEPSTPDSEPVDPDNALADSDTKPPEPMPPEPMPPEPMPPSPEVNPIPEVVLPGAELGRYISDETVLSSFDARTKTWLRVPPRALIAEGQKYVSLPVYRPQIALSSGAQITLVGEGSFVFSRPTANDVPALAVDCGRVLLHSNALPKVKTELSLNGMRGTLTLDTPESVAAIEVTNYLWPGQDPLAENPAEKPTITISYVMAVSGTCTWQAAGAEGVVIRPNFVEMLVEGGETRRQGPVSLPSWIDPSSISTLERDAATLVEPALATDRPLPLSLEEQANHRRIDVRVHVARCLAFLNRYETMIKELSEVQYKAYWLRGEGGYTELLRRQLARGPEVAGKLKEQLIEVRGERDGTALYRLLLGYSPEQLVNGFDEQLVIGLTQPNMDLRVLSFDNLQRITGQSRLYSPEKSPDKTRSIKPWEDALKKGEIRYVSKPSPFQEFKPLPEKPGAK